MGSSTSGKKSKKEKKHKRHRSRSREAGVALDLTQEGDVRSGSHKHHKHKRSKEHHSKHKHHKDRAAREQREEVIAVQASDSDSSDCVEVPVDGATTKERPRVAPLPPQISKYAEYEKERHERAQREKEREREKEKERERERERERQREKERERERYEREREMERRREREAERERVERERYREREREREQREREREKERMERERHHHRERAERGDKDKRERVRSRSHSPIPENGAGDVLSVEETNKLRAKLGLKPLEVETGPTKQTASSNASSEAKKLPEHKDLSSYKDEWGEFLHKPADNLKDKAAAEKMREKLKQRKEKRFVEERLARIRTLGESDEEVDDVNKWVQRNKKAVDLKKEAEIRAKALEEMDAEFGVDALIEKEKEDTRRKAYSDKHLKGLKVDHDVEEFSEGKTVILTLKDKGVLDEEDGDTLVNVNMIDNERYRKNVDNKKQNPLSYGYNVYEEQYDMLGNPIERGILEKYDEDVDGKTTKKKNFVIGENLEEERQHQRKLLEIKTKLAGKRLETLADINLQLASDTFSETELAKFKKPKKFKKVKKMRQTLKADDLLPLDDEPTAQHLGSRRNRPESPSSAMDTDFKEPLPRHIKTEEEEGDLERVLSKARKLKQKENLIMKTLPIEVNTIKQEIKTERADDNEDPVCLRDADGHIILNSTAEFCRTLGDIPTYGMSGNRNEDSNDMMDFEDLSTFDETAATHPDEPEVNHGTWNSVDPEEVSRPIDIIDFTDDVEERAILDEEPDVGAGVANALRLALSKGYLEKEELNRPSNSKMAHLQAKNYSIDDKATGEDDKFGRRDRFHSGPIMDFRDKESFKPNVKLEYIDDNGRILNLKEAFRYLSHKFHGKGPGKNKIEKRLKKMEQEGLMKTMSSTDTPLGTLTMLQQKQKETKNAYVVLSGGKQTETMSSASLSKYK